MTGRVQDTSWHERRRMSIGASDMPVILGCSPYAGASALRLALEKRGEIPVVADDAPTEGHRQERLSLEWIEQKLGGKVDYQPERDDFATTGRLHANLDGRIMYHGVESNVELKAVSFNNPDYDAWRSGIPRHVRVQVQQQMLCSGLSQSLVVLFDGPSLSRRIYTETADVDFQQWLVHVGDTWWQLAVIERIDPNETWSTALTSLLSERWPVNLDADPVQLDEHALDLVKQWNAARDAAATAEKHKRWLESRLRSLLTTSSAGLLPDGSAIRRRRGNGSLYYQPLYRS